MTTSEMVCAAFSCRDRRGDSRFRGLAKANRSSNYSLPRMFRSDASCLAGLASAVPFAFLASGWACGESNEMAVSRTILSSPLEPRKDCDGTYMRCEIKHSAAGASLGAIRRVIELPFYRLSTPARPSATDLASWLISMITEGYFRVSLVYLIVVGA